MSARGEGAGQPSTSAQGQPAAPAPQKRGRGRPRKQQQVSTRAGWGDHPTSAPSEGPGGAQLPQRGSPVAAAAARCRPARGGGLRSPCRQCAAEPWGGEVGSRSGRPGGGGRWGRTKRVLGLSLLCTALSGAVAPADWKRQGSDNPGLVRRFPSLFAIAPGEGSGGRQGSSARQSWRA